MHRLTYNELRLDFAIKLASPLSIQTQELPPHFVRSAHPYDGELSLYIPGGTLKGTLRRAAEHVLQAVKLDCCDSEHSCDTRSTVKSATTPAAVYHALCSTCRIFGSPLIRSHLMVTDSFPVEPLKAIITRRNTGESTEIVQNETFYGTLSLRNFERWQVGLLALLIARINMADVQIGAHRSEGMGCIILRYRCLTLLYPGLDSTPVQQDRLRTRLHGVGQFMGAGNAYGFTYPDLSDQADLPENVVFERDMSHSAVFIMADDPDAENSSHTLIDDVLTRQAVHWSSYVRSHKANH
ncbi:MAG: RAMP superfamily CRISPR-associated protein [Chloroflexota bacterium]